MSLLFSIAGRGDGRPLPTDCVPVPRAGQDSARASARLRPASADDSSGEGTLRSPIGPPGRGWIPVADGSAPAIVLDEAGRLQARQVDASKRERDPFHLGVSPVTGDVIDEFDERGDLPALPIEVREEDAPAFVGDRVAGQLGRRRVPIRTSLPAFVRPVRPFV